MKVISIAGTIGIRICGEENNNAIRALLEEWKDDLTADFPEMLICGSVCSESGLMLPKGAVELRKGILFEYRDDLWIYNNENIIKVQATPDSFIVSVGRRVDKSILFFTVEMLVRFYAPKYGLVFMHAGAFIVKGKVNVLCAFGGVGKTEVTIYALERGAKFLADDFAIMNAKGEVFPYTKRINLCEYPYTDEMLDRLGKERWIYRLKQLCEKKSGRLFNRLAAFLETHYFAEYIHYTKIQTGYVTERRFYPIDYLFWADSAGVTDQRDINVDVFVKKMCLCLDIESRRYFDYDGYFRLKFPFLDVLKQQQHQIITHIANKIKVRGLSVKGRDFDALAQLIFGLQIE